VDQEEFGAMSPLAGLRVLTLEQFGAGPYGSMALADLGAEVIKIESPAAGGDASRHVGPHMLGENDSQYFQTFNLNKKSVTLDLKTPLGRDAFRRLAATADAVVNNLRGDQPDKLGLTYASLREVNPRIVCLHISAYGRDNERRGWPGYDYLMQAETGIMSVTGEPDGPPTRLGLSMIDFMTGITGVVGLLSAILNARTTGIGSDVDTCLFDVALHQLSYPATWYLNEGDVPTRAARSAHLSAVPVQTFETADGWLFIMCMTDKFFKALVKAMNRPDLASDERYATMKARRAHRGQLIQELDTEFAKAGTQEWLSRLNGLLPVAPVFDVPQALANPFVEQVGLVARVPHPQRPDLRCLASPLRIDGKRPQATACSALGADTESVLREIGMGADEIAALRAGATA
jgi:crotonobetainyl-CoA:carnitine CoA-transferase CaiB-like acyl-CoA transferase